MKRLIRAGEDAIKIRSFGDLFDRFDAIVYVDDINSTEKVYGSSETELDYDMYSDDQLLSLPSEELYRITNLHTIDRLYNLDKTLLSPTQIDELAKLYHIDPNDPSSPTWKFYIDDATIEKILALLREHDWVDGPFKKDKYKNFSRKHHVRLEAEDFVNIIHSLTVEECRVITPYLTVSRNKNNLGNNLIVFNPSKDIILANGVNLGRFKIYIKIDLTETNETGAPIALISFHD